MGNALQQAKLFLQDLQKSPSIALSTKIPDKISGLLSQKGKVINNLSPQNTGVKQPIATKTDGSILYSDGSLKQTPLSNRLNTLKRNVLGQQSWTPQAKQYLETLPIAYFNDNKNWG